MGRAIPFCSTWVCRMNRLHAGQVALARSTSVTPRHSVVDLPPAPQAHRAWPGIHRRLLGLLAWLQNPRTVDGGRMPTPIDMSMVERVDRPYLIGAGTFLVAAYFRSNVYVTDLPDTCCTTPPHKVLNRAEVRAPGRSNTPAWPQGGGRLKGGLSFTRGRWR
jgi:hypothetical protein